MTHPLGDKIGEGVFSDIHAYGPGQVVKLLKARFPAGYGRHEARMTRAVFAAGGPAPEVLDEVMLEGRHGMVLPRLDGPTLLSQSRKGAVTPQASGAMLASAFLSVHRTPPPPELYPISVWAAGSVRRAGDLLPEALASNLLALIARLEQGEGPLSSAGLCHGDLHPDNIILTAEGPRIIDWSNAVRAPAAFDLAHCQVLHCELVPQIVPDPERPRATHLALQAEYGRLVGLAPEALTAATAPWLPVARALALISGGWPAQREALLRSLEGSFT